MNLGFWGCALGIFLIPWSKVYSNDLTHSKNKELFINYFQVPFYSSPSRDSTPYRLLRYGEKIKFDNEYLHEPTKDWIPIIDLEGLAGYIRREYVLIFAKNKKFLIVSNDLKQKLNQLKLNPNKQSFYEIIDYLNEIINNTEFHGDSFIYFQIQFYKAIGILLDIYSLKDLDPTFINQYEKYMDRFNDGHAKINTDYLWEISYLYPNSKYAELAASTAVEFSIHSNCEYNVFCYLNLLNSSYLKYLMQYPRSKNSKHYSQQSIQILKELLKDKDSMECFFPPDQGFQRSFQIIKYRSNFLDPKYKKNFQNLLVELEKECFLRN